MRLSHALLTLTVLQACGATDTSRTRVTAVPMGVPGQGYAVTLVATIDRPAEDWFCPSVTVEWPDGSMALYGAQGCPTWAVFASQEAENVGKRWSWSRRHVYAAGGKITIVILEQGSRREAHVLKIEE